MRKLQLAGQTFGKWLVIESTDKRVNGRVIWSCICSCGRTGLVISSNLVNGTSTQCVHCAAVERGSISRHGHTKNRRATPEYVIWRGIKLRCYNKKHSSFLDYGARGIYMCDQWKVSFETFLSDMGPRPSPTHQIDRINNYLGYTPSNCRWVLPKDNQRNRRNNKLITFKGVTKPLSEWAESCGIKYSTFRARIRVGWDMDKALNTSVKILGIPIA